MITRVSKWGSTSGTCTEAAWSNPRDASRGDGMRRQLAPPSTLTSMEHSVANCSRPSSTVTFKPSHARNRLRAAAHLCVWAGRQRVTVEGYRQHSTIITTNRVHFYAEQAIISGGKVLSDQTRYSIC